MKAKHLIWIGAALVAVVAMAAGVAVIIDKYFGERMASAEYIECDSEDEVEAID